MMKYVILSLGLVLCIGLCSCGAPVPPPEDALDNSPDAGADAGYSDAYLPGEGKIVLQSAGDDYQELLAQYFSCYAEQWLENSADNPDNIYAIEDFKVVYGPEIMLMPSAEQESTYLLCAFRYAVQPVHYERFPRAGGDMQEEVEPGWLRLGSEWAFSLDEAGYLCFLEAGAMFDRVESGSIPLYLLNEALRTYQYFMEGFPVGDEEIVSSGTRYYLVQHARFSDAESTEGNISYEDFVAGYLHLFNETMQEWLLSKNVILEHEGMLYACLTAPAENDEPSMPARIWHIVEDGHTRKVYRCESIDTEAVNTYVLEHSGDQGWQFTQFDY